LKSAHAVPIRAVQREVLVFLLDEEEYGVDILTVQEIRGYDNVTPVPGVPAHVKGIMNLRGAMVPVVDLRVRFGHEEPCYDALTVVIILQLDNRTVGMVVDGVSDVVQLQSHEIKAAPELGSMLGASFLREVAVKDGRMLLLADIGVLVAADELDLPTAA